ncbi:glycosyltransferase family 32 protein [Taibaiella koreensis]|uniref:glycosyltransferase family 32 protein n=1 Tax=Taibaiella koreensis TaxID=1268548 RepID=UPI000E59CCB3|nr:glycosyltransferase [Taibaiella koreensis]
MIPRLIHLLCKDKEKDSPYLDRVQALHPGWDIVRYDDADMMAWVSRQHSDRLSAYQSLSTAIQRSDMFRILILYARGGFYLDTDIHCFRSLETLREHALVLGEEKTLTAAEMRLPHHHYALRIGNYLMGSQAGHPFLNAFLDTMQLLARRPIATENDVLETTGPGALTNFYHEQSAGYPDIHLVRNPGRRCIRNCCPQPSCHFGDFAAHLHLGSWRWQSIQSLL